MGGWGTGARFLECIEMGAAVARKFVSTSKIERRRGAGMASIEEKQNNEGGRADREIGEES